MSGHVFPFAAHTHDEAQRLLPWLANGTLEAEERAWLERHVESCNACRDELRQQQALSSACLAVRGDEATTACDADAAWRRMRRRLADPAAKPAPQWRNALRTYWRGAPAWFAGALAAQAILLLALGAVLYRTQPGGNTYRTLSAAPSAAASGNLVIVFDPQLSEAGMRRLLAASDARIVDGPNGAGAYVLAVPAERVDTVRDALRATAGVVMVEALGASPPP